jgi:hypothetical protein
MLAEQKAVYDARQSAKYAEERLQREERNQQQLARATGPGRPVKSPMLLALKDSDKKFRELRGSRQVTGQPVPQRPYVLQAVASGVVSRHGTWAVGGGSAGGVAHATGAGCSVGVAKGTVDRQSAFSSFQHVRRGNNSQRVAENWNGQGVGCRVSESCKMPEQHS